MTLESALITAVAALGGSVVMLFKLGLTAYGKISEKLDECERDRNELWKAMSNKRNN